MATIGQNRVRIGFNPGGNDKVMEIKTATAHLIDLCEGLKQGADNEITRCAALAMTAYEEAAMWAVKAATAGK